MQDGPVSIVRQAYQAYIGEDRGAIESLIAEDFHFSSPLDNRIGREAYFDRCWPNSATIKSFEFSHAAQDGERVFITYEAETTDGRRFRNTEIHTVRDDRITDVEVYFGWSLPHPAPAGGSIEPRGETAASPARSPGTAASAIGAGAAGVLSAGAAAVGALSLGALAIGAVAIGKLAIGQLVLGGARLRRGEIGELHIGRLTIGEPRVEIAGAPAAKRFRGRWRRRR
jgi:ketosteroid isomerase-like protein